MFKEMLTPSSPSSSKRSCPMSPQMLENLDRTTSEQLNELAVDLLDFISLADVEQWLSRHNAQ